MVSSAIWAGVALVLIGIANHRYGQWVQRQAPLSEQQYKAFNERLEDLQNQISRLSIHKGFGDE